MISTTKKSQQEKKNDDDVMNVSNIRVLAAQFMLKITTEGFVAWSAAFSSVFPVQHLIRTAVCAFFMLE